MLESWDHDSANEFDLQRKRAYESVTEAFKKEQVRLLQTLLQCK